MGSIFVICTISFLDATGYLQVQSVSGTVVKEGAKGYQERLYVDFGAESGLEPQVRWVNENDCSYAQGVVTQHGLP